VSFEEVVRLVLTLTLRSSGCLQCLRHTRPHCKELEDPRPVSTPLELGNIFVEYPHSSGDVPTYIRDWVLYYQRLRGEWNHLEVRRREFCRLWP